MERTYRGEMDWFIAFVCVLNLEVDRI
jgi:hypothetical protein